MTMQYDVKSAYTAVDAALVTSRTRLKGMYIVVSTAGSNPVTVYDNSSAGSGAVVIRAGASVAGAHTVVIPGEGILAMNGLYVDTGSADSVTLIYG
jgi:hypothetical protein